MYAVEIYARVRRACMVEEMSVREAPGCSACTGTRCARCWLTRRRATGERARRAGSIFGDHPAAHALQNRRPMTQSRAVLVSPADADLRGRRRTGATALVAGVGGFAGRPLTPILRNSRSLCTTDLYITLLTPLAMRKAQLDT